MENETVPTDEEINEMIARSDEEFELFQEMDAERERNRGPRALPRIMQEVSIALQFFHFNLSNRMSYLNGS